MDVNNLKFEDLKAFGLELFDKGFNIIPQNDQKQPLCSWSSEKRIERSELERLLEKASGFGVVGGTENPFKEENLSLFIMDIDNPKDFRKKYPHCYFLLEKTITWVSGLRCPYCYSKQVEKVGEEEYQCKECNRKFKKEDAKRGIGALFLVDNSEAPKSTIRTKDIELLYNNLARLPPSKHPSGVLYQFTTPFDFNKKHFGIYKLDSGEIEEIINEIKKVEEEKEESRKVVETKRGGEEETKELRELNEEEIERVKEIIKLVYVGGRRQNLWLYLSGWGSKSKISPVSIAKILKKIYDETKDEDPLLMRISALKTTYEKSGISLEPYEDKIKEVIGISLRDVGKVEIEEVKGKSGIEEIFKEVMKKEDAESFLKEIGRIFGQKKREISEEEYSLYNVQIRCPSCNNTIQFNVLEAEDDAITLTCPYCSNKIETNLSYLLPEVLVKKYKILTTRDKDENTYIYDPQMGIWSDEKAGAIIKEECKKLFYKFTPNKYGIVNLGIKALTFAEREFESALRRDGNKIYINVRNGVIEYNVSDNTIKLLEHSPDFKFLSCLNVDYKETNELPENLLNLILFYAGGRITSYISILEAWAYLLMPGYPIKKFLTFVGEPNTGKTTTSNFIIDFVGFKNVSGLTAQDMAEAGKRPFALVDLYGKVVNIADDFPSTPISNLEVIKKLTGNSLIEGEYKFGRRFKFFNSAKIIFSANTLPKIKRDEGFLSRIQMVEFEGKVREEEKVDINILKDGGEFGGRTIKPFFNEEEKTRLLNFLLKVVFPNLVKYNSFTFTRGIEETEKLYLSYSNTAELFLYEMTEEESEAKTPKRDFWDKYVEWCETNGFVRTSEKAFWGTFARIYQGRYVTMRGEKGEGNERERYIVGVTFKENQKEKIEKNIWKVNRKDLSDIVKYFPTNLQKLFEDPENKKYLDSNLITSLVIDIKNPVFDDQPIKGIKIEQKDERKEEEMEKKPKMEFKDIPNFKTIAQILLEMNSFQKDTTTYNFVMTEHVNKYGLLVHQEEIDKTIDRLYEIGKTTKNPKTGEFEWVDRNV